MAKRGLRQPRRPRLLRMLLSLAGTVRRFPLAGATARSLPDAGPDFRLTPASSPCLRPAKRQAAALAVPSRWGAMDRVMRVWASPPCQPAGSSSAGFDSLLHRRCKRARLRITSAVQGVFGQADGSRRPPCTRVHRWGRILRAHPPNLPSRVFPCQRPALLRRLSVKSFGVTAGSAFSPRETLRTSTLACRALCLSAFRRSTEKLPAIVHKVWRRRIVCGQQRKTSLKLRQSAAYCCESGARNKKVE